MKLYDAEIAKIKELFSEARPQMSEQSVCWPVDDKQQLLLRSETYCELGGDTYPGIGSVLFSTDEQLIPDNGIFLLGSDLSALKEQEASLYARFVVIRLKKDIEHLGESQKLYNLLRKIDYVRYHFYPKGFMLRISSAKEREVVRISKDAMHKGIGIAAIGTAMMQEYLAFDAVEAVQIFFCIDKAENVQKQWGLPFYQELVSIAVTADQITESMNLIFQGLQMDCSTCSQKAICDEIEGMKELHLGMT